MNRLKILLTIFFYSLISACTPSVKITPEELPEAKYKQPYYAKFEISGGSGPVTPRSLTYSINPINSGIELDICDPENKTFFTYNCFIVKGIPKILHNITIKVQGGMVGRMFMGSSEFSKTYVIKVKNN